jgi:hypothetical protein
MIKLGYRVIVALIIGTVAMQGVCKMNEVAKRDGRTWVSGVGEIGWGKDVECTYAGSLQAALKPTKCDYAYDEIMAASGLAFRVRWWRYNPPEVQALWCPSTPVGEFPEELGWTQAGLHVKLGVFTAWGKGDADSMEKYVAEIKSSIDKGIAVCAYPNSDDLNMALVFGYTDNQQWMVKTYSSSDKVDLVPFAKLGPLAVVPMESTGDFSPKDLAHQACELAIKQWTRVVGPDKTGPYLYGLAALEAWKNDLSRWDKFNDTERKSLFFLNWWNMSQWADARQAAASYLLKAAKYVDSAQTKHMLKAADHYTSEVALLFGCYKRKDTFLGPWSGKSIADYTKDVRDREIDTLTKTAKIEEKALKELAAVK